MTRKILISGQRDNFTILELDTTRNVLCTLANYPAPANASWVELFSKHGDKDHLVGLSEGEESGLLYTFEIDHGQKSCVTTSSQSTLGAPSHFITVQNKSSIALATYLGGSVALYPITIDNSNRVVLQDVPRTEILPEFPYKLLGHGPDQDRQRQCHVHQVLEDSKGLLYAPDLGSDRVWMLRREGMKLGLSGWLQCPPGTGVRHGVLSPNEKILYVIGELSHKVIAFDLPSVPGENIQPIDGFSPSVIPPMVHPNYQNKMDASEICLHPTIHNVLYISNRWERHIAQREPFLKNVPIELPPGDSITIVLLSSDGRKAESVQHVQTNVDVIRGMRLSDDGNYMIVIGQEGGGVEIYKISGSRAEVWTLTAALNEGLEGGLKHAIWL